MRMYGAEGTPEDMLQACSNLIEGRLNGIGVSKAHFKNTVVIDVDDANVTIADKGSHKNHSRLVSNNDIMTESKKNI